MKTRSENTPKSVVDVGRQINGATFRLSHKTRNFLASRRRTPPTPSSVFVSSDTRSDLEHYHGALWTQIVMILTGLTEEQIYELGGFEFVTPADKKTLFESTTALK